MFKFHKQVFTSPQSSSTGNCSSPYPSHCNGDWRVKEVPNSHWSQNSLLWSEKLDLKADIQKHLLKPRKDLTGCSSVFLWKESSNTHFSLFVLDIEENRRQKVLQDNTDFYEYIANSTDTGLLKFPLVSTDI